MKLWMCVLLSVSSKVHPNIIREYRNSKIENYKHIKTYIKQNGCANMPVKIGLKKIQSLHNKQSDCYNKTEFLK